MSEPGQDGWIWMDMDGKFKGMEEEPAKVRAKPQTRQSHECNTVHSSK